MVGPGDNKRIRSLWRGQNHAKQQDIGCHWRLFSQKILDELSCGAPSQPQFLVLTLCVFLYP